VAEKFAILFSVIDSFWPAHAVFQAIEFVFGWIALGLIWALALLLYAGTVLQTYAKDFVSYYVTVDGRIWSPIWSAISYMPTVMAEVLLVTFAFGVGMSIFWYLQLRYRAPSTVEVSADGRPPKAAAKAGRKRGRR